jgi:hypothetical protein
MVSASGNQIAKPIVDQWQKIWVSIDFLEIAYIVVSDVTDFRSHPVAELVLDSEVPLLRVGIAEVGPELQFRGEAGIALRRQWEKRGSDVRAVERSDIRGQPCGTSSGRVRNVARLVKGELPSTLVARL